jgi:hypothetical protein
VIFVISVISAIFANLHFIVETIWIDAATGCVASHEIRLFDFQRAHTGAARTHIALPVLRIPERAAQKHALTRSAPGRPRNFAEVLLAARCAPTCGHAQRSVYVSTLRHGFFASWFLRLCAAGLVGLRGGEQNDLDLVLAVQRQPRRGVPSTSTIAPRLKGIWWQPARVDLKLTVVCFRALRLIDRQGAIGSAIDGEAAE